jgi:penicillin-binding protein 1A
VATVWTGFDQPRTTHEHGSQIALPIWIDFMQEALVNQPIRSMRRPDGITAIKIDPVTGFLANSEQQEDDGIFEIFTADTAPTTTIPEQPLVIDNPTNQNEDEQISDSIF